MAHLSAFRGKVAGRYSKKPVTDKAAYQKKLRIAREYFRPDIQVLEIDCDTASATIVHAPRVGHIHAMDISPTMITPTRFSTAFLRRV